MKLKTVSVGFDFVIVVDDDDSYAQQQSHAEYYMREALGDAGHQCVDITIWDYPDVPCEGWDGDCIPYGGDGNTRTSEYLTKSS
jgi:hypothetical protein